MSGSNGAFVCLLVCLLVCFNTSCFLTRAGFPPGTKLYVILDFLGEKGDSSLAPPQCFGTANHGQRQNESVLIYQKPLELCPKAFWLVFPVKCPLCNPLARGCWHLTVIKTHREAGPWAGGPPARHVLSLLLDTFCPSCTTCSLLSSSSKKTCEQQQRVLQPHRV